MMRRDMPEAAFADLRVIDLSQGVAGAYCTKLLADYGADVIKVEPPGEGDPTRRLGPFPDDLPHPEKSGLFLHLNTNKRSLTLDVSTTSGAVILKKLLARADILVESFPPGRMAEWGLAYEDLRDDLPKLVYASITPFGRTGPYRDYRGNSITSMAMSGVMYVTGDPDKEPLTTGGDPIDYVAGVQCWVGVLAALAYRDREGKGQQVDVSLAEAAAALDEYQSAMYGFLGIIRRRFHSRHVFSYPMDIMPCRDGYVCVIPGAGAFPNPLEQGSLSPMALLLGDFDLDKDLLFLSMRERLLRPWDLDAILEPWLMSHDSAEIVELAQQLRMPFAHVPTVAQLLESEHLRERGFFVEVEHPQAGRLTQTGAPFEMSEAPFRAGPAPTLGEDNTDILCDELGYDIEDLGILRDRGIM
jgi:crotonobetainyl-CoA:carnitine CoA-transferase CaiB-like acyl-CoA transferase